MIPLFLFDFLVEGDYINMDELNKMFWNSWEELVRNNVMTYICDSEDIDESPEHGEYLYYYIELPPCTSDYQDMTYVIFANCTHTEACANILYVYKKDKTYVYRDDTNIVDRYDTNKKVLDMFQIKEITELIDAIKKFLKNTDRPFVMFSPYIP